MNHARNKGILPLCLASAARCGGFPCELRNRTSGHCHRELHRGIQTERQLCCESKKYKGRRGSGWCQHQRATMAWRREAKAVYLIQEDNECFGFVQGGSQFAQCLQGMVVTKEEGNQEWPWLACDIRRACSAMCWSPISPCISAFGTRAATESTTTTSTLPERV